MVRKLEKRFAPPPVPGHAPSGGISFDRFLMACVTVKHYTEAFRKADARGEGRLTLDYNEFVSATLGRLILEREGIESCPGFGRFSVRSFADTRWE